MEQETLALADSLHTLWEANPKKRKLLGLDWGEKRLGLSVSDRLGIIASPLTILTLKQVPPSPKRPSKVARSFKATATKKEAEETKRRIAAANRAALVRIVRSEDPLAVVVGLPVNMDGSLGFQARKVLAFAEDLKAALSLPLIFQDERWSSAAVERLFIDADATRAQRLKRVDKAASAYMLQAVLDYLNKPRVNEG
ncbi:putative pre-16S rRNA nuclease [Alphaproteobacteria bacterium]|nr:putative pre-16S rRNA nuclease [Alphaproteobacteria bacterium]GHS98830.1 putative pre-16S rRNA nuclease [Alphaproteobacteria bacterium]